MTVAFSLIDLVPLYPIFKKIFLWILQGIVNAIDPYLAPVAQALPNLSNNYQAAFVPYLQMINFFVPLDVIMLLVTAYFAIVIGVMIVQWIVKFIPTL